jgi:hypothetical protein
MIVNLEKNTQRLPPPEAVNTLILKKPAQTADEFEQIIKQNCLLY